MDLSKELVSNGGAIMKKLLFAALFLLLLASPVFAAFERNAVKLPIISEPTTRLDEATGWMQSPSGEWIERKNRIPKYLSNDYEILLDYDEYSLGVDNFIWIELRTIKIQDDEFYLLLRARYGGWYKYPSIEEGWSQNYQIEGYVFKKEEWGKIKLVDRVPSLLRINLIYQVSLVYYSPPAKEQYIEDISKKINERINKTDLSEFTYFLNINTLLIDNAVRFILIDEHIYTSGSYKSTSYSGVFSTDWELPIKIKETVTPEVFENFYYETDYDSFSKLFLLQ
jgi:hypothetical protein